MANDFLDLLRRSQLIEEEQLSKFLADLALRHGGQIPEANEKIAAALISAGLLTEWQADKLLAGKHKGFLLGKYKLLRHLGKGGMSQVYLAEHVLMKRKVAIKVLPANKVGDATYLERFRIEARAAARLDDPNIVRVYDIDTHEGTHFIVMEYVEGQDLHVLVKDGGPLSYERAADYVAQVARGLSHAHSMNLIHRDIKPANCLLDKNETVKLLDMGLARMTDDEASLTLDNNENVLGTADYLAPEQALNSHKADTRADIYSLGCTLYFLLTGHPPFPDGTISERLLKHQVEQAPSIFKDRQDAPTALVNICIRMMAKRPEERYQTAGEVVERLSEWLVDRGYTAGDGTRRAPAKEGSGGLGSDAFRRFGGPQSKPASDSGLRSPTPRPTSRPVQAPVIRQPQIEEDIGLAPLEEEAPKPPPSIIKPKEPAPVETGAAATTPEAPKPLEPPKPTRSLLDEELESNKPVTPVRAPRKEGEFDPLKPPGFQAPTYGTPAWVYVSVGVGVVVLLALIVAVAVLV